MTLEHIARLYVIFKTLAPEIKEWIASDDTAAIIKAISARFVLSNEQEPKLPILVLRLVTQDLPPESFKAELIKEVGVDENLAKEITEAIAKEVINPIAAALRYSGVDTNLIGFNAPAPTPTPEPTPPIAQAIHNPQPEISATPTTQKAEAEKPQSETIKPFILHEEPTIGRAPSAARTFNYNQQTEKVPAQVTIERVVHYSNLRTPLNIARVNKNTPIGGRGAPKPPQSKWFI